MTLRPRGESLVGTMPPLIFPFTYAKLTVDIRCDRILWKTTIKPEPINADLDGRALLSPRNRVSTFFSNRFRSPSSQTIRDFDMTSTAQPEGKMKVTSEQVSLNTYHYQNGEGFLSARRLDHF